MPEEDLPRCFARCFRGTDGDVALRHLRRISLDIATGPDVTDARLRHLEGQRFMANQIITLVERGRK
ncbi:MAG: hypothetical protein P1U65_17985 [Minwuia sp.]|nr:hypothetical protein [Minwuia sp.]